MSMDLFNPTSSVQQILEISKASVSNHSKFFPFERIAIQLSSGLTITLCLCSLYYLVRHNREFFLFCEQQFDHYRSNRFGLIVHTLVWLIVVHGILIAGGNLPSSEIISTSTSLSRPYLHCTLLSIALHYSLMVVFSFQVLHSLHLYILVTPESWLQLTLFRRQSLFRSLVIAFTVPILVVLLFIAIALGFNHLPLFNLMRSDYFCSISPRQIPMHPKWLFIVSSSILFVLNVLTLILVQYRTIESNTNPNISPNRMRHIYVHLSVSYTLLLNLTLPWIVYSFSFTKGATIIFYLLIILNATQGTVLFVQQIYFYKVKRKLEEALLR